MKMKKITENNLLNSTTLDNFLNYSITVIIPQTKLKMLINNGNTREICRKIPFVFREEMGYSYILMWEIIFEAAVEEIARGVKAPLVEYHRVATTAVAKK